MKVSKPTILVAAGAIVIVLALIINWAWGNSVTNKGNRQQAGLSAQYPNNQNYLSDCEVKSAQVAQVPAAQTAAFDKVISDAVKGRYSQGSSAQVGQGALFSAIQEAYPDITSLGASFSKVMDVVTGCRTDYRNMQSKLLDMLKTFDAWRTGSWGSRHYGKQFPNDNLVARIGDQKLTGKDAEDKMYQVVLTGSTLKEYQSGTLDPSTLNLFGTTTTG